MSYGATLFGYGMWSVLLGKYTAAKVAPLSLLIPVIDPAIAQIILHESITGLQLAGCGIIMLGLIVSLLPQLWQSISPQIRCLPMVTRASFHVNRRSDMSRFDMSDRLFAQVIPLLPASFSKAPAHTPPLTLCRSLRLVSL
ncbi:EamA family transporter [Selenomonas sp. WCT3]|uniref:EamA family transporter n=1 Tax=Selenomonas sp. WCT3 TaxID=3158785 RepID=UPI00399C4889